MNGFRHDGPTRTRSVAAAISSSAGSAGWNQRSLNTVTTSKPGVLRATGERRVVADGLVGLQCEAELAPG